MKNYNTVTGMFRLFCLMIILLDSGLLPGQNLIPNWDFEELECPDNDYNSVDSTNTWQSITRADFYWLHEDCPVDEDLADIVRYLNPETPPFSGKAFVSFEGVTTVSGFHFEEGVGIELTEPMEAGRSYYFEMVALNQQVALGAEHPGLNCGDINERLIEIHFSDTTLNFKRINNNFGAVIGLDDNSRFKLTHPMNSGGPVIFNKWLFHWDCFVAPETLSHIGITGNIHQVMNSCVKEGGNGVLIFFGHSIDAVQLHQLPTEIDTIAYICHDGGWTDLHDFIPDPFFDKASYLWFDGCTEARRVFLTPGVRTAEMILPCGNIPITLDVRMGSDCEEVIYSDSFPKELILDLTICTDEPLQAVDLQNFIPKDMRSSATFEWDDGSKEAVRVLEEGGIYEIEVFTDCYAFPIVINAEEGPCQNHVFVPNIFSPNNDGINDELRPYIHSFASITTFRFKVFDRWGNFVYSTNDISLGWDGKMKGKPVGQGVYLWLLDYQLDDGTVYREVGETMVIR